MPQFAYVARNLGGEKVSGTVSAGTEREAVSVLSGQDLFPLDVQINRKQAATSRRRVRAQLVARTYTGLASLLRSGVPLLRSLEVLRQQTSNAPLASVLDDIHAQVEEGATLADALARHPRVFTEMATSIVRAGGEGGFLEESLDHVAEFTEMQQDLKSRTIAALFYPVLLAVFGTIIVAVLIIFFVPRFETLFARLREIDELPVITDWLLGFSHLLQSWWPAILISLVVVFILIKARLASDDGRRAADRFKLRLPLMGGILRQFAVARFCRVLGTLLRNGVPILRSLEISSAATGNAVLGGAIQEAAEDVSEGQSLAQPLADCGHFPADVVEMIAVAEESNTLERVLIEIKYVFS